jgi:outer membrane biosynthesis protein TonB
LDKRRLAYEVAGHREGIYILMYFTGEAAVANELDRMLRISDDCFRHLITRVEPKHIDTSRLDHPQTPAEPVAEAAPTEAPAEAPAAEATEAETPVEAIATEGAAPAEETAEPVAEEAAAPTEEPAQEAETAVVEESQPEPAEPTVEAGGEEPKAEG